MAAKEFRRRQVEQAVVVLVDQPAARLRCRPILAGDPDRRTDTRGCPFDHGQCLARLRRHDRGYVALEDAGLFGRDLGQRVAEMLGMIERYWSDDAHERAL